MYESIGLKDFKRFKELEKLELGPITFFVGPNNSGKSTVIQAAQILSAAVSKGSLVSIDLAELEGETGRILDWSRLIHQPAKGKPRPSFEISYAKEGTSFTYVFSGDETSTKLNINSIDIDTDKYRFKVDRVGFKLNCAFSFKESAAEPNDSQSALNDYSADIAFIESQIKQINDHINKQEGADRSRSGSKEGANASLQQIEALKQKISAIRPFYLAFLKNSWLSEEIKMSIHGSFESSYDDLIDIMTSIRSSEKLTIQMMKQLRSIPKRMRDDLIAQSDLIEPKFRDFVPEESIIDDQFISDEFDEIDMQIARNNLNVALEKWNKFLAALAEIENYAEDVEINFRATSKRSSTTNESLELIERSNQLKKQLQKVKRMRNNLAHGGTQENPIREIPDLTIDMADPRNRVTDLMDALQMVLNQSRSLARSTKKEDNEDVVGSFDKKTVELWKLVDRESRKIRKHFEQNLTQSTNRVYSAGYLVQDSDTIVYDVRTDQGVMPRLVDTYYRYHLANDETHEINIFVNKWLSEFGIGDRLVVVPIQGGAYHIKVEQEGRSGARHLSDYGRGTAQIVFLLLSMAVAAHENRHQPKGTRTDGSLLVLEEPEVNLHPNFQSRLVEMLLDFSQNFEFQLIVETHSEYLIRKTQILHSKQIGRMNNPNEFRESITENKRSKQGQFSPSFAAIYFSADKPPYGMIYRSDGKFENEFGSGFFDVSSNLAFEIL